MSSSEAVDRALLSLREMLAADGYGLDVTIEDRSVQLAFRVTEEDSCGECLVPRTIMEPMVQQMLLAGGVDADLIVHYPPGHIDA